ncbi:spore protease YyaC [Pontibacillus litoralis]|uniref:Sporulation protein n=1 Tax=Pontibacillus litoralis JSM 072002 TaxID=1385512 RepID=A0A0A5G0X5_9BACI|nr:spore protease YyaC [Pontibacillus litoralis]KGX85689.1 hypothetical protein N784_08480 [Pontibacillus litoralis JSM 072002]
MNLKQRLFSKSTEHRFHYQDDQLITQLCNTLMEWVPPKQTIVIVCIGTDRSTGDALGPLIGTLLQEHPLQNLTVYGTLDNPVHAVNLVEKLEAIQRAHPHACVIGIDACLGKVTSIGTIIVGQGPVKPGLAVKKQLPDVGHLHITGVVNVSGFMEYFVLQNTRLHLVMQMAKQIVALLVRFDQQFPYSYSNKNSFLPEWSNPSY